MEPLNSVTMKKNTRSILEEINAMSPKKDKRQLVESNARHVMQTAINLIEMIDGSFPPDVAEDLQKRLINSIRTKDPKKFIRGIQRIEDNRYPERDA
jgi:fructose-1-phosphate kinase PfkB-like protein